MKMAEQEDDIPQQPAGENTGDVFMVCSAFPMIA
jgi:hypothetical protein